MEGEWSGGGEKEKKDGVKTPKLRPGKNAHIKAQCNSPIQDDFSPLPSFFLSFSHILFYVTKCSWDINYLSSLRELLTDKSVLFRAAADLLEVVELLVF